MRTTENKLSWTMLTNSAFVVLYIALAIANNFGYANFEPSSELIIIAPAIVALINLLIRYFHTRTPIQRGPASPSDEIFGKG